MGAVGILVCAFALAPAPSTSRVELSANANVNYGQSVSPSAAHTLFGGAELQLTAYLLRPLVDDDAPLSLQPFLQSVSKIWLAAGGGGERQDMGGYPGPLSTERQGGATAGIDVYVNRSVALHASLDVVEYRLETSDVDLLNGTGSLDELLVAATTGLGVRWEDTRIDVTYRLAPVRVNSIWRSLYFGDVTFSGQAVLKRRHSLSMSIHAVENGALAQVDFNTYFTRRLGLNLGFWGGRGAVYIDNSSAFSRIGGGIGGTGWLSRHLGATLGYSLTWTSAVNGSSGDLAHVVSLSLTSRAR